MKDREINAAMRATRGLILKAPPAPQSKDRRALNQHIRDEARRNVAHFDAEAFFPELRDDR